MVLKDGIDPAIAPEFGWKTSWQHWNDDAVHAPTGGHDASGEDWQELWHPNTSFEELSLDMAFVIVPEPVTIAVLALGLFAVLLRNHRRV